MLLAVTVFRTSDYTPFCWLTSCAGLNWKKRLKFVNGLLNDIRFTRLFLVHWLHCSLFTVILYVHIFPLILMFSLYCILLSILLCFIVLYCTAALLCEIKYILKMAPLNRSYTTFYWSAIYSSILYRFLSYLTLNNITHSLVDLPRWGLATADDHSDIFLLHCARSCDISFSWI